MSYLLFMILFINILSYVRDFYPSDEYIRSKQSKCTSPLKKWPIRQISQTNSLQTPNEIMSFKEGSVKVPN